MKFKSSYTATIILVTFILTLSVLNMLAPVKTFSDSENRMLQTAPKFSLEHVFDGSFTKEFQDFISDQFYKRDTWIGIKSESERILGKSENNGIYLGKDGYLLQKFTGGNEKILDSNISAINEMAKSLPNMKVNFMLVPNSVKVLSNKLPDFAPVCDESNYIKKAKSKLTNNINFIDVYDTLFSHRREYIYYKTDHHWTTKGAYYAYKQFLESYKISVPSLNDFKISRVTNSFYGSLYSESGFRHILPDSINLYFPKIDNKYDVTYYDNNTTSNSIYNMKNLKKKDKYTIFLDNNHSLIKIHTDNNTNKKLLIIKDSYANSLIPFLTQNFSDIYVVDLRYYTDKLTDLIKKENLNTTLILYNVISFSSDNNVPNINWK